MNLTEFQFNFIEFELHLSLYKDKNYIESCIKENYIDNSQTLCMIHHILPSNSTSSTPHKVREELQQSLDSHPSLILILSIESLTTKYFISPHLIHTIALTNFIKITRV